VPTRVLNLKLDGEDTRYYGMHVTRDNIDCVSHLCVNA